MRVTKFQYPLEDNLIKKLDLLTKRCVQKNPKRDVVLNIEGAEGEGKTSLSIACAYYVRDISGMPFDHTHIFFDVEKMIKFLQDTEGQIAIYDEPALQSLSGDSLSKAVKNLKRLLMMCRNRRHFIMINMTYFTEFGNYIVWQRPLGMIHVYSRNELESGRFVYIRKKFLERLWHDWRSKKQRNYKKYASKRCRGTFPDVLNPEYKYNVLSEFNYPEYEKNKNLAIMSIGKDEVKLSLKEIRNNVIHNIIINNENNKLNLTNEQLSKLIGITLRTFYRIKATPKVNDNEKVPYNINMGDES
jgi:hypothetical protein